MADTAFEVPDPDPLRLKGKMAVAILDPNAPGTPVNILDSDHAWAVKVDWELDGSTAPFLGGTFHVKAFVDDVDGVAPSSGQIGASDVPVGAFNGVLPRTYTTTMNIAAGAVQPGLYRLVVAITYDNGNTLNLAAFAESGIIQVYQDQP